MDQQVGERCCDLAQDALPIVVQWYLLQLVVLVSSHEMQFGGSCIQIGIQCSDILL